jgi:hypothetical protein
MNRKSMTGRFFTLGLLLPAGICLLAMKEIGRAHV